MMDSIDRMVPSEPEEKLARLLNKMESGWGDHFRAQETASEGFLVIEALPDSGYPEIILSIYVAPDGKLNDEGALEESQVSTSIVAQVELRSRGSSEGDEIIIRVPVNREERPTEEELRKLDDLLARVPQMF
jgi:hypothetical protein